MKTYPVEVNGKKLIVADYPGKKGPIVMIHGLTGNCRSLLYFAERFAGEYRVIALDLRGRGLSDEADADTSMFAHADDVNGLIDAMGLAHPILMGHSMGAFISTLVAGRRADVQAVVLLDGAARSSKRQDDIVKPSLGRLSKQYPSREAYAEEIRGIYAKLGVTWNDTVESVVNYEVHEVNGHWENRSDPERILSDWCSFARYDPCRYVPMVHCPMLLLYAKESIGAMGPLFLPEDYADTKRCAENLTVFVSDCNHYTMVFEERKDLNDRIAAFLSNTK